MRSAVTLLPLVLAGALAGCESSSTGTIACPTVALPALVLRVLDRTTGAPVVAGTSATAIDGAWSEAFRGPLPELVTDTTAFPFAAAYERPGTYQIEVRAPGYPVFTIRNVTVTRGRCNVNTVQVTARLVRAAP